MLRWPMDLARREREIGPEDEFDDETNGDPDSLVGEEDDAGFEEMACYHDEALDEDGFEDAGDDDDGEDTEIDEEDDDEDC